LRKANPALQDTNCLVHTVEKHGELLRGGWLCGFVFLFFLFLFFR
jgi:hypothetical protein